jgi:hypothetical protein
MVVKHPRSGREAGRHDAGHDRNIVLSDDWCVAFHAWASPRSALHRCTNFNDREPAEFWDALNANPHKRAVASGKSVRPHTGRCSGLCSAHGS